MKIIYNSIIPVKGFLAISICGLIFVRKEYRGYNLTETVRHEKIHFEQQKELLFLPFFILYFLEWVYRLIFHTKTAYRGISFEREAYRHEKEKDYKRKHFAQWREKY